MAEPKSNESMEKIVSLCKRRGFVFQSSEIYGGINGFWDYGPLGAELKRNVKELWWRSMTQQRDDVVGLEATIIMAPEIWRASGHVETFADMMVEDPITNRRFRADLIEPQSGIVFTYKGAISKRPSSEQTDKEIQEFANRLLKHDDPDLIPIGQEVMEAADGKRGCIEEFSVLLPEGKPPESARKTAKQYFERRGVELPQLVGPETREKVVDSVRYSPETGAKLTEPRPFNLMFKTYVGPVADEENVAYLRPETAQAIFAQFKNVMETSRQKLPFGIAQIGKAFRNEVTPRNFTFRSREFEQMELEFFIKPDEVIEAIAGDFCKGSAPGVQPAGSELKTENLKLETPQPNWGWEAWHRYWVEERVRFYESIGLPRTTLVEYWQKPEELAHYARATVDILFKFPFSKRDDEGELAGEELEGIAARSDFDLSQHERFSGKPMGVFDEDLRAVWAKLDESKKQSLSKRYYDARFKYLTKTGMVEDKAKKDAQEDADGLAKGQYIPHVIEPSAGVDRLILALICHAYDEEEVTDEKGAKETRVVMRFHPRVAPVKVAVFPLLKNKPELVKKALEVRDLLRPHMTVFYDDAGAIGRRYRRQDEAGTPYGVTIDFDTLGEKGPELKDTVTLRDRDTMKQERVKIDTLVSLLSARIR
jgi:glycyl-tRNA synthetase